MNWCASAYAGWGRMRFNQTLNVRVGFPKAAVTLVQDKMFLLLRHNFRSGQCVGFGRCTLLPIDPTGRQKI